MSKTYLDNIGTRNSKYQGYVSNNKKQGIGILIDDSWLLCLSLFSNNQPSSSTFIVYPNRSIFYGSILNNHPIGICCFQPYCQSKIIANFNQKGEIQQIAFKLNDQLSIYEAKISDSISGQQIQIVSSHDCEDEQKLQKKIGEIINEYNDSYSTYKKFIQSNFDDDQIQINETRKTTFIGFKDHESLGLKLKNNEIQSLGIYTKSARSLIMGCKYQKQNNNKIYIEEGIFSENKTYGYIDKRPSQAMKTLQQYYKKSTNFDNKFQNIQIFEKIQKIFLYINTTIKETVQFKYGQSIIQGNQTENNNKIYTLNEIKDNIYKAIHKKSVNFANVTPNIYQANSYYQQYKNSQTQRQKNIQNKIVSQFELYNQNINRIENLYRQTLNYSLTFGKYSHNQSLATHHINEQIFRRQNQYMVQQKIEQLNHHFMGKLIDLQKYERKQYLKGIRQYEAKQKQKDIHTQRNHKNNPTLLKYQQLEYLREKIKNKSPLKYKKKKIFDGYSHKQDLQIPLTTTKRYNYLL